MTKPLIGCTTYYINAFEENKHRFIVAQDHFTSAIDDPLSIHRAGGIPVPIPLIDEDEYIDSLLDRLDGLMFIGGSDVSPSLYGQPYKKGLGHIDPARDKFELKLLDKAVKRNLPLFGICRGLQLLNVYFGGTLVQDIERGYPTEINHAGFFAPKSNIAHKVKLSEEHMLYPCFGKEELAVNSFHHQMIDKLGDGLEAAAISEDGIIEAIVHKQYPFLVAVQWHPEMMFETEQEQLKLFQLFVDFIKNSQECVQVSS
ncbi:gamma-glutamyl-gamma-aminobutyrate hydrolase [Brevibacillus reuszeri]|uniref:Gamma-glutamyl-gamma-aminobutyrate hydrolase n=1 Tax=Brevibacillus reuszeri TaxID=54915 RepID=A0A0K9YTI1_9BACL|nr:gamma-glutamyl-gamma-aminobutyrate hydrolase family protein [Brevibacillus reuszeri]KNB71505.1 peptidase C26 [Brevibacillus reuszeri]MED1855694.1 gamma-glutamyl-gamma-aminobutyrate hydrolase family protein [Brevibacillus reuszeri]GED67156.1 gamma-glutamyl-gamma-aminobutyrate hydrolase [Brevibacillus reuszeri]